METRCCGKLNMAAKWLYVVTIYAESWLVHLGHAKVVNITN
jgi:hypothetical protein